ncbi:mediator of RNA polymerase II transcription subunit 17 [Cordyceps militaris]|uniref:Mediator of RNA polymerase II transcription subunit 17 n=1 Tax=Cordyceps militaris TaxID=73501 RepID=A0A2H4SG91_CORMI|nr:mediator of RNA polymerase II transcription subunit 17 [Cordyceps militaris]
MGTGDGPPLSMRPFPVADKSPRNLADFIARVNAAPGGFRIVTETSLAEEIDARHAVHDEDATAPAPDLDTSDDADDNEDDDEDAAKDPRVARDEVLKNIDIASNTAMLTLDSLSLLLSKQNPTQAGLTLSPQLREMVGIGTLGADRLDDSNTTPAKTQDRAAVGVGWTLMAIDRARDAADDATAFLRAEMAAEGRYWQGVMRVRQAGWSVCRVPHEREGALGVRFGFSEAAPEFQRNGLAPLRRAADDDDDDAAGVARLDIGRLGGTQERLVVTYERGGEVVGRAAPPRALDDTDNDDDLEARVLGARDTIFAQELWHELTREARSLAAYDVRTDGEKRLVCAVAADARIIVELLPLAACHPPDPPRALPEDTTAQAIALALHILLTYAHRCNELMRCRPLPPHIPRTRGQQIYTLLRPVVARLLYARNAAACTRLVGSLVRSLRSAGLAAARFTLRTPQPTVGDLAPVGPNQVSAAVGLVRTMLQPTDFALDVALGTAAAAADDDVAFSIRGRTYLVPVTATYYHVLAPPDAPIHALCGPYADGYPDLAALAEYLCAATARVLAAHHLARLKTAAAAAEEQQQGAGWVLGGVQGTRIIRHTPDPPHRPQLEFSVERGDATAAGGELAPLQVTVSSAVTGDAAAEYASLPTTEAVPAGESWTWTPDRESSATETLEAVVDGVLRR